MSEVGSKAPQGKFLLRRVFNRVLHPIARVVPGSKSVRLILHRWRGVKIGKDVFIGDAVYIDNEYPECVEIHDRVEISIRAILIAHTRGPGKIVIEQNAFIGPNAVIACGAGRTLRIGEGAVIGPCSVITKSVPARLFVAPPASQPQARVKLPLPLAEDMASFWAGLVPLKRPGAPPSPTDADKD